MAGGNGGGVAGSMAAPPGVLAILGASGDLTKRLLIPALYNLTCDGLLPDDFAVVGMARKAMTSAEFRLQQRDEIGKFNTRRSFDPDAWDWLESRLHYTAGEFTDPAAFARLRAAIDDAGRGTAAAGNTLLYLAIAPEFFATVNDGLAAAGFTHLPGRRRLIVEKPFGKDLASALALNRALLAQWKEEEIYRIDHYLGKETVQNLLAFRLANPLFAPVWNADSIDHVQISATETVGVETRGGYYDKTGVVRDMLQNHLLQVLAYVCMEPPASLDPDAVRDEKARVLESVRIPSAAAVRDECVRGQYGSGKKADGSPAVGYREEPAVDPASATETYAALTLHLDNARWRGMPVYLRSGKSLWKRGTEVVVQFKPGTGALATAGNVLVFHIQPHQGVEIRLLAKRPGTGFELQRAGMRFDYADTFEASRGTGYEVLLHAALGGDPTLFSRTDFVEAGWRIMQPVLDTWQAEPPTGFPNYAAGSWGPQAASDLLSRHGRRWQEFLPRDALAKNALFATAPPVLLNTLALALEPLAIPAGSDVVRAGDHDHRLFVVCHGRLEVIAPDGTRLSTMADGDCFGEMALLLDQPRSATVRALTPCDLLVLDGPDYGRILADFPAAEEEFRRLAAQRR
ncbi:MAG: glucose-6-phosphate dehydrogenase [Planctomycetota bacterium]